VTQCDFKAFLWRHPEIKDHLIGVHELCSHLHEVVQDALNFNIGDRVSPVAISRLKYIVESVLQPMVTDRVIDSVEVRDAPPHPARNNLSFQVFIKRRCTPEQIIIDCNLLP